MANAGPALFAPPFAKVIDSCRGRRPAAVIDSGRARDALYQRILGRLARPRAGATTGATTSATTSATTADLFGIASSPRFPRGPPLRIPE
jgi:hypothetical protein